MKYEFEDSSTYKLTLEAIANGKTKLNEIKDFIKLKRTDISPYLKNLINVKMIKRAVPITENIKSRKGRYYLQDNFLKFWFKYIYSNLSSLEEGIFDIGIIKKDYNSYLGYVFEEIIRQYLIKKRHAIFDFTKLGSWWHKDTEIDLVALNDINKEIMFIECKWQDNINAEKILEELQQKSKLVDWNNNKRVEHFAVFAKSFKKKISGKNFFCFDLKDLEKKYKFLR